MNIHIENLTITFPFLGTKPVRKRKTLKIGWIISWKSLKLKKKVWICFIFCWEKGVCLGFFFALFHALPRTQWKQSKDETVLVNTLRFLGNSQLDFQKLRGNSSLAPLLSLESCLMRSTLLTECWVSGNCPWKSLCCLLGPEGNLLHYRVRAVKTIKALPDTLTLFETTVDECDFEWLQVYRRQAVCISSNIFLL